ncbi:hypothetical protein OS493_015540 [Desmophyllum pertusum]|uniref:Uncharacterized protein n=1 Tax=Desmophyllum pertusum TaxID=174260 RepID=A0A9W9YRX9_9CNID|nr:hypothetical protein OS493_015540 [Desmophyllum pertusum]
MSVQKLKKSPKDVGVANGSVSATVKKAFKTNSNWEDKTSFSNSFRHYLGLLPLKGILAIGLFALINAGVLYIYFTNFQKIDEEEYGGPWELTKEGFMTSFALFLVIWIIFYSAVHFP